MKMKTLLVSLMLCYAAAVGAQDSQWVGTWAAAAEFTGKGDIPSAPLTNRSLREIVHVSLGGECLRLRLSNEFSAQPLEIKSVFIADALDSCDRREDRSLSLLWGEAQCHHRPGNLCRERCLQIQPETAAAADGHHQLRGDTRECHVAQGLAHYVVHRRW